MSKPLISAPVIKRLPRYYRFLGELENQGFTRISSRELSEKMGLTASQIRQDLNCFGGFGQQGYGYNVKELHKAIGEILGINAGNRTILIGSGIKVSHTDVIEKFCKDNNPVCAVLCIPKSSAQEIANRLVTLGIKGFWNFSHYDLKMDHNDSIIVENVHLADSLMTLAYGLHSNSDREE